MRLILFSFGIFAPIVAAVSPFLPGQLHGIINWMHHAKHRKDGGDNCSSSAAATTSAKDTKEIEQANK